MQNRRNKTYDPIRKKKNEQKAIRKRTQILKKEMFILIKKNRNASQNKKVSFYTFQTVNDLNNESTEKQRLHVPLKTVKSLNNMTWKCSI